ncbi:MAG: molecular chaperone DnaJ [Pseudanabaenaceae cyanobacterium bins.39]|nr:molecular chaperone DnaJ [Pseudanabaenaceae cyanobacterium bins.39]
MPKKTKKTSPANSQSVDQDQATNLGLSDLRLRLNFLEKENSKLIKQIETNRTKIKNLQNSIQEVGIQIAERSAPLRQKLMELDNNIHGLFQEILTTRKLGKKSQQDIKNVYAKLQFQGLISPKNLFDHINNHDDATEDEDWEAQSRRSYQGFHQEDEQEFTHDISKPDREELKKIRQTFLRLADYFHPDKVLEESEKEYRTEIMKEINLAYQNADLARLLAIEQKYQLGQAVDCDNYDDLAQQCARVEAEHQFLQAQLKEIKQELKQARKTDQGEIVATFKKIEKYGGDPIGEALSEIEEHIEIVEQIYQFVSAFRDRRMTIKEFLKGPSIPSHEHEMTEEELILEFLSQFT